jgi:hypothetical protein
MAAVQAPVEIRYAGVVIGKTEAVREDDAESLFLSFADPMPVGALLELRGADTRAQARVEAVTEVGEAGMRVRLLPGAVADAPAPAAPPGAPAASGPGADTGGVPQAVAPAASGSGEVSGDASRAVDTSGPVDGSGNKKKRRRRR